VAAPAFLFGPAIARLRAITLLLGGVLCCRPTDGGLSAIVVVDDAGDSVRLASPARRIVSLNPTITELLFSIGAGRHVVGRTRWCDYPPEALSVPSVGNGFPPNVETVIARHPDLVVLYHNSENGLAAKRLRELGIPVLRIRTDRLSDVPRAARLLGRAAGSYLKADSVARAFTVALERASAASADAAPSPTFLLLAWDQPIVALGSGSFVSEMVERAGGRNVFADLLAPSAPVSMEAIAARHPDAIMTVGTMTTGFAQRPEWRTLTAVRRRQLFSINETAFTRPSLQAPEAIRRLRARLPTLQLHP
jgi:iron complex transport system substrate-binding protein